MDATSGYHAQFLIVVAESKGFIDLPVFNDGPVIPGAMILRPIAPTTNPKFDWSFCDLPDAGQSLTQGMYELSVTCFAGLCPESDDTPIRISSLVDPTPSKDIFTVLIDAGTTNITIVVQADEATVKEGASAIAHGGEGTTQRDSR